MSRNFFGRMLPYAAVKQTAGFSAFNSLLLFQGKISVKAKNSVPVLAGQLARGAASSLAL